MALRAGADREILEANLAFHLHAGIDVIVVWAAVGDTEGRESLEGLELDDRVRLAPAAAGVSSTAVRRWMVDDFAADWLIESEWCEFWWPRTGSIPAALEAVPSGSNAAQAVVRTLFPTAGDGPFEGRFTVRLSPRAPSLDPRWRPLRRFAVRASAVSSDPSDLDVLWGYYPFEVLRLAEDGRIESSDTATGRALELGVLVPDERLHEALRGLRAAPSDRPAFSYTGKSLIFAAPDPTEEAVFALEAAVLDDLELSLARQQLDVISRRLSKIEGSRLVRTEAGLRRAGRWFRRKLRKTRKLQ